MNHIREAINVNKVNIILPTTYMGSVEWYKRYYTNPTEVMIEVMESFPKQTYRNRCTISQPTPTPSLKGREQISNEARGKDLLTLSVPVKRADSKQLTRDVEISYQQRWQHQHWIALVSAYKRTPYFDYYAEFFRPFYEKETKFLVDLNEGLHNIIVSLVQNSSTAVQSSSTFTTDWQAQDLETSFGNGQSILDTLFEYGPESAIIIQNS